MAPEPGPGAGTTILLNGKPYPLARGDTVQALLQSLKTHGRRLAVEVNGRVVPRSRHPSHALRPGDRVEVVQAVGGG